MLSRVINSNKLYLLALPSRGKLSLFLFSSAPQLRSSTKIQYLVHYPFSLLWFILKIELSSGKNFVKILISQAFNPYIYLKEKKRHLPLLFLSIVSIRKLFDAEKQLIEIWSNIWGCAVLCCPVLCYPPVDVWPSVVWVLLDTLTLCQPSSSLTAGSNSATTNISPPPTNNDDKYQNYCL